MAEAKESKRKALSSVIIRTDTWKKRNNLDQKRLLRALNPTVNPTPPSSPLNHVPAATYAYLYNTSSEGDSITSVGSLFQRQATFLLQKVFPISNLNVSWHNLKSFPLALSLVICEKRPTLHLATTSFQAVVELRSDLNLIPSRLNIPSSSAASQQTCAPDHSLLQELVKGYEATLEQHWFGKASKATQQPTTAQKKTLKS